jgi:hypothetical protein
MTRQVAPSSLCAELYIKSRLALVFLSNARREPDSRYYRWYKGQKGIVKQLSFLRMWA